VRVPSPFGAGKTTLRPREWKCKPPGRAGVEFPGPNTSAMSTVEVSRTLVKSPPELWAELERDCLAKAVGEVRVTATEPERRIDWRADGASGTALLEPAGWGTKLTLTAEVEDQVAELGFWARVRGQRPPPPKHSDIERKLTELLDDLGSAHRKPFVRE
jgi:hypothetical protein